MQQSQNLFFTFLLHISNLKSLPNSDSNHSAPSFTYQKAYLWGNQFPECNGKMQSPINIIPSKIQVIKKPSRLKFTGYDELPAKMNLKTNGHTVKLYAKWKCSPPFITGGHLKSKYVFDSLHFHWGLNSRKGSEHRFSNISFPLEMHMVHYKNIYGSAEEAAKHKNSFAVIGMVFEISDTESSNFSPMANSLSLISGANDKKKVEPFKLSHFNLRPRTGYIIYLGSLTTPPCSENVIWLLSTHVLSITKPELRLFREDKLANGDKFNYRPIQRLNKRKILYYPTY